MDRLHARDAAEFRSGGKNDRGHRRELTAPDAEFRPMISAGQLIAERVMLKNDTFFAISARDGTMRPGEFLGDGLWCGDTRILSELRVLINAVEPAAVGFQNGDGAATFELEAGDLLVTRVRFVETGLHEHITVSNRGGATVDGALEIQVAAGFAGMLGNRRDGCGLAKPGPEGGRQG